jgi:hypothetical protein
MVGMIPEVFSQTVSRRHFIAGSTAGLAALGLMAVRGGHSVSAQSAQDFASLGYPELDITVTDTGFEGVPDSTAAGRYLVNVTNNMNQSADSPAIVAFMSPTPIGMTADEFLGALAGMGGGGAPSASPAADEGSADSGSDDEESGPLPLFIYQIYFAGGAAAAPGTAGQAVIDLKPGEYVVWGDDPSMPQQPVVMTVTGDFPESVDDPEADITATLIDFAIQFEGNLTPGSHVMKVQHAGAQPHFLEVDKGPDSMTKDQVMEALMADESATPTAGGLDENAIQPVYYSPTQSIGTVTFQHIDLEPATYLAACFFPTAGTGVPHAMEGMIDVFTVSGEATPQA